MRVLLLSVAVVALAASGCVATARTFVDPARTASNDRASWTRFSIGGSAKRINARRACPAGVARVETEIPLWGVPIALLTVGIITPVHVEVTCAAP